MITHFIFQLMGGTRDPVKKLATKLAQKSTHFRPELDIDDCALPVEDDDKLFEDELEFISKTGEIELPSNTVKAVFTNRSKVTHVLCCGMAFTNAFPNNILLIRDRTTRFNKSVLVVESVRRSETATYVSGRKFRFLDPAHDVEISLDGRIKKVPFTRFGNYIVSRISEEISEWSVKSDVIGKGFIFPLNLDDSDFDVHPREFLKNSGTTWEFNLLCHSQL